MKIKRRVSKSDIPVMAMGDIAFNLLIFFVILAKAQDDSHLKWQPAEAAELIRPATVKATLLIDKDEKIYLNAQEIGESQVAQLLEDQLEGLPAGKRIVLLKCHKAATALRFQPVLEAIGEAGGDLVHVLDEKKEK